MTGLIDPSRAGTMLHSYWLRGKDEPSLYSSINALSIGCVSTRMCRRLQAEDPFRALRSLARVHVARIKAVLCEANHPVSSVYLYSVVAALHLSSPSAALTVSETIS